MKKNNNGNQTVKQWCLQNATWIMGIIFLILNIYLTTKLAPLAQGIEINRRSILALDEKIIEIKKENVQQRQEVINELKYIRERVDNLYIILK